MAVIKGIDYDPVFTDIMGAAPHAFAQVGSSWYFAYINNNHDGVVYKTDDKGVNWDLYVNYGQQDWITATSTYDGSELVVTVSGIGFNQTIVYKSGNVVMEMDGYVSEGEAVCFWPYLVATGSSGFGGHYGIGMVDRGSTTPYMSSYGPIWAAIGYGPNGTSVNTIGPGQYDIGPGWEGRRAIRYTGLSVGPLYPSQPHSPVGLVYGAQNFGGYGATNDGWLGLSSRVITGFINFDDFNGFGVGGLSDYYVPDAYAIYKRGLYFTGYGNSHQNVISDRGLVGPLKAATGGYVDGYVVGVFVDAKGLIGSTVSTGDSTTTDSAGSQNLFVKAKIYGTAGVLAEQYGSTYAYSAQNQGTDYCAFILQMSGGTSAGWQGIPYTAGAKPMTLFRLHDPDILNRPHGKNTELISQTTTITQAKPSQINPYDINSSSNSLGAARTETTGPSYGLPLLIQACSDPSVLPNPNKSPGCSPILRELLRESGVAHSIVKEMSNDGDPNGHQGGNALDLAGPSSATVLVGASVTDAAYQEMGEVVAFLRAVPELFAAVIHFDPINPANSLFIWDGQLVNAAHYGGANSQLVKDAMSNIHISSSKARLLRGFKNPKTAAALGLADQYTDANGNVTNPVAPDPFNTDRYVYVNDDGYVGSTTTGLAAEKQPANIVNFW